MRPRNEERPLLLSPVAAPRRTAPRRRTERTVERLTLPELQNITLVYMIQSHRFCNSHSAYETGLTVRFPPFKMGQSVRDNLEL